MTNSSNQKENENLKQQTTQQELNNLKNKYDNLVKEMQSLENNQDNVNTLKEGMESMYHGFEQINKNMQEITNKLNKLTEERKPQMMHKRRMRNIFKKLAIGTVSSIMCIADNTAEKASGIKEEFEDIVAEAHYENQKKRMKLTEDN